MHTDSDSISSFTFGKPYEPKILNYSQLNDNCHYLHLSKKIPHKRKRDENLKLPNYDLTCFNDKSLEELEEEKSKILKAMETVKEIEVINLISDEENDSAQQIESYSGKNYLKNSEVYDSCFKSEKSQEQDDRRKKTSETSRVLGNKNGFTSSGFFNEKIINLLKETKELLEAHSCNQIVEKAFGDFRCKVCNVEVHSEVTLQNHLTGKKHRKALKAQAAPEVARQSLEQYSSKLSNSPSKDLDEDPPNHYPRPAPGMTRCKVKTIAKLQPVAESYRLYPVIGLSRVIEIILPQEIVYYCDLCDANCPPDAIMRHLIGFKHRLNFIRIKYPSFYLSNRYKHKSEIDGKILELLRKYERTHGRGLIKVEEEVKDRRVKRSSYPSSYRGEVYSSEISDSEYSRKKYRDIANWKYLDISMNDFYCKICDSHMNNEAMWESHITGRRHLKNKKKRPGENPSKRKAYHCPGETAKLENDLKHVNEPVIGLNFVREVQGCAGNQYNCFPCGACCTNLDIIDHIISEKHRLKVLVAENKGGKKNGIETISGLINLSNEARKNLIAHEAAKFEAKHGKGKVDVYRSKDIYSGFY